jgi:ATP-dependent exoDNAse (exonuclease V) beta subunit
VTTPLLVDVEARERIGNDLDTTLFVDAGAGSGKTHALVERVLGHVRAGHAITDLAAITFTEKAAAELRQRIRARLEGTVTNGDPAGAEQAAAALRDLDRAAISTLHSFAQRLLLEHPVEAGLPPNLSIADEIASDIDFEGRWQRALRTEITTDPALERPLQLALEAGVSERHLRDLALAFESNWDLVAARMTEPPPDLPRVDCGPILDLADELLAAAATVVDDDKLRNSLVSDLAPWQQRLAQADAAEDSEEVVQLLSSPPKLPGRVGLKHNWTGTSFGSVEDARAACARIGRDAEDSLVNQALAPLVHACLLHLASALAAFTVRGAEERRVAGHLSFHDLLVLARRLLHDPRHGTRVRSELRDRYRFLLIDEFQDTDPLQLDIAEALARPPGEQHVEPGRLFFVGDPKQSIYRFRRADINVYLRTPGRVGAQQVSLTTNFRSHAAVLAWVNAVFGRLIRAVEVDGVAAQPAYQALAPVRTTELDGPPVVLLGADVHTDGPNAEELRAREASDVAAVVRRIRQEGWTVAEEDAEDGQPVVRPACFGDIAILIPARTSLAAIEGALDDAGIPHRTEAGALAYATDEARMLLLALRAVDDPSDHLAIVCTLRSPLYGCSDVALYEWIQRGGRWNPFAPRPEPPATGADPVGDALADLERRCQERALHTPSELLDRLVRDRRVLESSLAERGARDAWRRIRFVIDHARAWSEAGGVGLRAYLDWAHRQGGQTGRVPEVVLPETDEDAVRIMTIHAAKGLQFKITVVAGLTTEARSGRGTVQVLWHNDAGPPDIRLRKHLATAGFDAQLMLDEQLDEHERLRLLYVACTRARDHLVVSLHRKDKGSATTAAKVLAEVALTLGGAPDPPADLQRPAPAFDARRPQPEAAAGDGPSEGAAGSRAEFSLVAWRDQHARLLADAARVSTTSATALATMALSDDEEARHAPVRDDPALGAPDVDALPSDATDGEAPDGGLLKEPVDLDLPPWRKGRYGTAIGRAVHAVLQAVDLATGAGVDELARAQAAAEGVIGEEATIATLARSALASPTVRAAAGLPHWRELYVGTSVGGTVLEGYVDLLVRREDGLVVVDHKTDYVGDDADVAAKVARYRLQAAAYAVALESLLGEQVVECRLVFCRDGDPIDVAVPDLSSARDDVRALVPRATAGRAPVDA